MRLSLKKTIRHIVVKRSIPIYLFMILMLIDGCHSVKQKEQPIVSHMEKQITEINRKIDEIDHRMSMIQFLVDSHERTLKGIENNKKNSDKKVLSSPEQPISLDSPQKTSNINKKNIKAPADSALNISIAEPHDKSNPITPDILYNRALAAYKKEDYNTSINTFGSFAEKYPKHELADNALYWKGECYYSQKNYTEAISIFKQVLEKYPKGSKVPDALLKTGYSYLALDSKDNARLFLKKVVVNFPFSPAGTKAEEMLKKLK